MSDNNIELSRRRILAGLGTIGIASAATGAGTMALLSDEETSSGNVVQAGTLDLVVGGQNPVSASFNIDGVAPGDSGEHTIPLTNDGNVDGYLNFALIGWNKEGDNPESETDTEGKGDLGDVLQITFQIEGVNGQLEGTFNEVFNKVYDMDIPLPESTTKEATVSWSLPSSAGNEIQGDKVVADVVAFLNQEENQPIGQTFDVEPVKGTPGSGTVDVVGSLVQIDTSTFDDPASQWVGSENIGFWFGNDSGKVEVKWYADNGWKIPANNNGVNASLSDFGVKRDGDILTVTFDSSAYDEFALYVEPENQDGSGAEQAVATKNGGKPWNAGELFQL